MAKERLKSPRLRAFVALELPGHVVDGIAAWGKRELTDPALRPVPRENIHATLIFLGWQAEKDMGRVAEILQQAAGAAPCMQLQREVAARPGGKRPSVFALEASSPGTIRLHKELEQALKKTRLYKPEKRPFWPHVTVARVRDEQGQEGRRWKRKMIVKKRPGKVPEELLEPFDAVRLTLYRSILRREGPIYDPLAQVELPAERAAVR